ncbi:MAG: response regulator [Oscillospiraceae bacterium]
MSRAIRALDRPDAAAIPIIALTANAFADDVRRAKEAGMNEHLAKPLELDQLMQTLSHYIR